MTVPAARLGFWIAVSAGALSLACAFFAPVPGLVLAALFLAVACGIRKNRAWAAIAGACLLAVPFVRVAVYLVAEGAAAEAWPALLFWGAVVLVSSLLLLRAARELSPARPWPWVALIVAVVALWTVLRPYAMPAGSMSDTILAGDHLLVETASPRLGRLPRHGDIVVLRYPVDPRQTFVKRVVGLPGDRLRIENKRLYRNGEPVAEPWATHKTAYVDSYRDNFPAQPNNHVAIAAGDMLRGHVRDGEIVVPDGRYFVLGDNRDNSLDSRYWGFVSRADIVGRPLLIYGSYEGDTALNTRWRRLLKRVS
jgi:signal peptidase I